VINRGNYRTDIFQTVGAKKAFESCLFEACAKSGWWLHAYVVMRNHYHLALQTPGGNLVSGMQWLQATFANRFNRLRNERGHLFQGRYKSLLVEPGAPLGHVCHYVHLNPMRAGIVPMAELRHYRFSSYWYLFRPRERPAFLRVTTALQEAGGLADTGAGRQAYARFLDWQSTDGPAGRSKAFVTMSKGWALGSGEFKAALVKDHALAAHSRAWEAVGAAEIKRELWQSALTRGLRLLGQTKADALTGRKSAPWKVAIAADLKQRTQASNRWLCDQLNMGTPVGVSQMVGQLRRRGGPAAKLLRVLTEKPKT
jgi:REP element-mobilizing transposase RayT